jgi:thiamine kinase-like enzyme
LTVLHAIDDLTSNWLTTILREKGVLSSGHVTEVKEASTNHQASLNYFLNVTYSPDATASVPKTLFLKLSRPERLPLTASEVEYYTKIVAQTPLKITPTCYSAEHDSEKGAYHILLEDVSATHTGISMAHPPIGAHAFDMVKTLARLHAHWWEKPSLNIVSDLPTEAVIGRYVDTCRAGLSNMFDFLGDRITDQQKQLIDRLTEQYPLWMVKRTQYTPNHLTLIHGDCHNGNWLLPKAEGETYLIDRQPFDWSLTCWLGVSDLTYMMVHWWYPKFRERFEEALLHTYHDELLTQGVTNYSWSQLWDDYRLCAIQSLYVPLAWCSERVGEVEVEKTSWIWYPKVVFTLDAIEHLGSHDLLEQSL